MQGKPAVKYPTKLLNDVRHLVCSGIAGFSANDVPDICVGLGLRAGDTDESFRSKYKYAERRVLEKSPEELISVSDKMLERYESFDLLEAKSKLEECAKPTITEITRRRIVGLLAMRPLSTELETVDFLERIWPLRQMPSQYSSRVDIDTLHDDYVQATVRNDDWDNKTILENVQIYGCSQRLFFRFLEELVSPIVRDHDGLASLADMINDILQHDGFRLTVVRKVSGSPIYEVQPASLGSPADMGISDTLEAYDSETVHARWMTALDRRETDPEGAITVARTLLEDVCKWITVEAGEEYEEKDELPQLYRRLAKILKLAPDDHTEQIFKQILGSCQSVVESLGALRNKISDAHSLGPRRVKPAPRHAQLAVNLSGSMAEFLVSTWNVRKKEMENKKGG